MTLALSALAIISLLELLMWWRPVWRWRKPFAYLLLVKLAAVSGIIVALSLNTWTVLLLVISLYRIINLLRIIEGRVQADYLYYGTRQTALCLIGMQLALIGVVGLGMYIGFTALTWWYVLAVVQAAGASILLTSTIRHLRTTRPPALSEAMAERDLPALTVAIPARNETEDLEACLKSLITSTYPKLEILVLDDCSQNRHTPEIIRSFARDGVRFIAGTVPPGQWLAKNHAYAQLAGEATGELLLFCGVDVRFEPNSLNVLVKTMLQKHKTMISVIPRNIVPGQGGIAALFTQPNRYAWELALPRRLLRRPPVLSTCWLITQAALTAAGGFEAVTRRGVPESYFAKATAAHTDGYSFMQSDSAMGIVCRKNRQEQQDTAVRTRYLQLHRRPELVILVAAAEFALLIWPLIMTVAALLTQVWLLAAVSGLSAVMTITLYAKIVNITYRKFIFSGLWILPIAALYDIGLLNYSMWRYEFGEVLWKGRNICIPVMRVLPKRQFTEGSARTP